MSKKIKITSAKTPKHTKGKKRPTLLKIKILFCIGALLLSISGTYYVQQLFQLSFFHENLQDTRIHTTQVPTEILIDKVHIDLPVYETTIAHNVWQIADNGASHLESSSRPGENGTDIIYAHNTNDRFGPIEWLSIGDNITVVSVDKKVYTYHITQITTVDPNNPAILSSQKGETLILYTCTGFADLQRFVIIAKPGK